MLNNNIKKIRNYYALTQVGFGERIGVTGAYISEIERGNRSQISDTVLKLISTEFNVSKELLFNGEITTEIMDGLSQAGDAKKNCDVVKKFPDEEIERIIHDLDCKLHDAYALFFKLKKESDEEIDRLKEKIAKLESILKEKGR